MAEVKVVTTRSFFAPRPWRHPILWWKLRHLRREMRRPKTLLEQKLDEAMDRAFLLGEG